MADSEFNPQNQQNYNADNDFEDQLGSSARPTAQVTEENKETLIQQARDLKKFFDEFETEFTQGNHNSFFIISTQWLNQWKKYVSYDEITAGQEPNPANFGQVHPDPINEDLLDQDPRFTTFKDYPEDSSFTNVLLRDGIQEGRDYQLITEEAWKCIEKDFEGTAIKRPCRKLANGQTQVEVRLKKIQLVPVNNALLRSIDHERARDFKVFIFQAPSTRPIKDIRSDFIDFANSEAGKKWFDGSSPLYYSYSLVSEDTLRFWKLDPEQSLDEFFKYVKAQCKKSTSYEYRIEFKGNYLLKDIEIPLIEAEIADNDHIFIEVREQGKGWNFIGDNAPSIDKCDFCNKYQELPVACPCKKVAYCSDECKFKDKRFHQMRCDRAGEEEEEQNKTLALTDNSRRGLCGLQNLGNTCFMNSGLQCLSNVKALTDYFLTDKYLKEINETNALGSKGKLVRKYGGFLKNLWFATASVQSPWALKSAISEFQSMFSGYQQHDSQELLAFLLDGLHEDLNRVKVKPFTETIESEDQPDYEVGLKSWENHLKRNQSIIVDLLHGQYKSKITCPTCNRISITFDPFNSVSLPIPAKLEKEIDFEFVFANNRKKPVKLSISFPTSSHTVAQLRQETAKILNIDPNSFYFVYSTQHLKEIVTDEANTLTNTLRKKKKIRSLFAFEMAEEDIKADPQEVYDVDYITSKKILNYFGRVARKKFTHFRTASLRKHYTTRQIYLKMFQQYRILWDDAIEEDKREQWNSWSDEEAFKKVFEDAEDKPFKIFLVTNSRVLNECFFCGEKRCENCELKFDSDIQLSTLLSKIKDPDFNLQFEVYFDEPSSYLDVERLNSYTDLTKIKTGTEEKTKGIDIYDCFEQFEEPETLGEENAWYCSKCKEHQKATKRMEIYKAPPILMVHLKRFKSGGSMLSKSKIVAQVDFPLENLDISEYVINSELPLDYPVEKIIPGYREEHENGQTANENGDATLGANGQQQQEEAKTEDGETKKPLLYDLFAVVNHYGNLGFGHYTAYGKNHLTNKWYCFDDSSVQEEDPESVCSTASYVLFYRRKGFEFNY